MEHGRRENMGWDDLWNGMADGESHFWGIGPMRDG